ncbi:hypothetical protein ACQ4PT_070100 [Festuca glaucescens]
MFRGGGCCPPMDLMRSETMQLVQVIIPAESARLAVSNLGDLGLVQSKDVNIQTEAFSEKYLGLPTAVGKLTSEAFEYITESARSSVNGWAEKNLSYPGKEALLKSVIQAKPIHGMSCFLLSKGSCKKFTSVMGKFWWSGNLDKRSMHWLAWDKLAVPKSEGGMGFRDMQAFNVALLGKQAWRITMKPDSLCSQVLRTRYLHNQELMAASAPRAASRTWKAILAGREALKLGLIKRVGSGQSISIWEDNWLPNSATMRPMGQLKDTDLVMVNELMTGNHEWNEPLIRELFFAPDADSIMSIPLRSSVGDDWLAWSKEKSGIYTVRSAYRALMEARQSEEARNNVSVSSSFDNDADVWKRLWKLPVVPKVRVFWWRVLRAKSIELVKETLQTLELPRENPKPTRLVAKWQRPPDGFVKINSDGAFNVSENLAATGVVAREGLLYRGAMGKTYRGISDPLIIETLALRDAVTYARDRGFSRVVFEVDSENLVHLWHNRAADRSMVKNVLDEIDKSPFQRTYAAQIKRCGEMTRKMHFFKEQMSKAAILTSSTKFSGAPLEIDDLEIKLGEFETDLIEVNTNNGKLQRTYNELVEYNVLLQKTGEFFYSAQRSAAQQQSEIVADQFGDSSLESPLMEQEMVTDPLKQVKLGFLSGLVPKQKAMAFERILFRATRGNMLLQQESVDEPVTDPQFGEKVVKNSFVIFYSGERAKSKIVKICDAFGANRYPFPEDLAKQLHTIQEVGVYPRVLFLNPSLWSFCFVN